MLLSLTIFLLVCLFLYVLLKIAIWNLRRVAKAERATSLLKKYGYTWHPTRVKFLDHEDREFLLLDLTYASYQDLVEILPKFKEAISQKSGLSLYLVIDLTDGTLTLEGVNQLCLAFVECRSRLIRSAIIGYTTLPPNERALIWRCFLYRAGVCEDMDEAYDFLLHDDALFIEKPGKFSPISLLPDGTYNSRLIRLLFSRLLAPPDEYYLENCRLAHEFFVHARTRKLRLLTGFLVEIERLSLEQLRVLYVETFKLDLGCSLEVGCLLGLSDKGIREFVAWMEGNATFPDTTKSDAFVEAGSPSALVHLPPDHISNVIRLQYRMCSAQAEDTWMYYLGPAIETLLKTLKGLKNPYEKLIQVVYLELGPGGDPYLSGFDPTKVHGIKLSADS
jgi:nitrate reductase assembly molybdenum cofactor insertion protein NarJ